MKLSDIIVSDAVIADLNDVTRDEAIKRLMAALVDSGAISARSVKDATAAVLARERQATTGIGKGVALPHAKIKTVKRAVGAIGRSATGIEFGALDSKPVYVVILLLSNPDNPD